MAYEVIMPKSGMSQESGTIVSWLKKPGERVQKDEAVLEIETDKVVMEVESEVSGTFLKALYEEGDEVPVTEVIAYIGEEGEEVPERAEESPGGTDRGPAAEQQPRAKESAAPQSGIPDTQTAGGRRPGKVPATPRARSLARERGISLDSISGSGEYGAVTAADIPRSSRGDTASSAVENAVAGTGHGRPLSRMRARVAREMTRSSREVPQVTLSSEAEVSGLLELRGRLKKAERTSHVTINDVIVKAAAHTVREMPAFRSFLIDETVYEQDKVNIGVAVAVEEGLLVPVVKDADLLGLSSLAQTSALLIKKAREGRLKPEEMEGGVFTVSNLGMYGIRSFTPMILMPQSAILGVNTIFQRPELADGELQNRSYIGLSLTIDHRIIDGAAGAVFLQKTGYLLEHPELLLAV